MITIPFLFRPLVVLAFGLFAPGIWAGDVPCPQELKSVMANYETALVKKDIKVLTGILADDFQMITASGRFLDKKALMANLENKETSYHSFESTRVRFQRFGDTVIETGQVKSKGVRRGKPIAETSLYTDIWILKEGAWKLVFEHSCFAQSP